MGGGSRRNRTIAAVLCFGFTAGCHREETRQKPKVGILKELTASGATQVQPTQKAATPQTTRASEVPQPQRESSRQPQARVPGYASTSLAQPKAPGGSMPPPPPSPVSSPVPDVSPRPMHPPERSSQEEEFHYA